jgi:tRNA pseudouridine38-40 synthase
MVRNLVGTLLVVGRGRLDPAEVARIRDARDRRRAGPAAPARGLTLVEVFF